MRGKTKQMFDTFVFYCQNPREASSRPRIFLILCICVCVCVCIYVCICVTPPGQTKIDTDLKFGTNTAIDLILKRVFLFFDQIPVTAASLEKLPCHVDFPHISSIALFSVFPFSPPQFTFPHYIRQK